VKKCATSNHHQALTDCLCYLIYCAQLETPCATNKIVGLPAKFLVEISGTLRVILVGRALTSFSGSDIISPVKTS